MRAARRSASTRSATRSSGAARCGCTRRSRARRTAASGRASARRRRSRVGLKVDVDALPRGRRRPGIKNGTVDLDDPATTLALLKANAVVGVTGLLRQQRQADVASASSARCATRPSTTRSRRASAIASTAGPNRDLERRRDRRARAGSVGAVAQLLGVDEATRCARCSRAGGPASSTRSCSSTARRSGPTASRAATLIPPAFGLAGVNLHTWTGWGSVTYWNAFVANLEMHGKGTFFDPRLDDAEQFPVAARERLRPRHATRSDLITPKLAGAALLSARDAARRRRRPAASTRPPPRAARRCSTARHVRDAATSPPLFTEPGWNMHTARRSASTTSRRTARPTSATAPRRSRGLWTHTKGGFYHDGRFATLADVVDHYDTTFTLGLTAAREGRPRRVPEVALIGVTCRRERGGTRTARPARDRRVRRRHGNRVVRLLSVRRRGGARVPARVLPDARPLRRRAALVQHVLRRVRGAPGRCGPVRSHGRSRRALLRPLRRDH